MALTIQQIQDNITNKQDAREIINQIADYIQANPGGGGSSYLVYTALLTQSGTNAPTAEVLEDTIGDITLSRLGVGRYDVASPNITATKTSAIVSQCNVGVDGINYTEVGTDGSITIYTTNLSSTLTDGALLRTLLEIRVYP